MFSDNPVDRVTNGGTTIHSRQGLYQQLFSPAWRRRLRLRQRLAQLKWRIRMRSDERMFYSQKKSQKNGIEWPRGSRWLITSDREAQAGEASGHYFHQDLLVAQEVFNRKPRRHVDVGSSISGFCSHVAAFREIDIVDIRPLTSSARGMRFHQLDLMSETASSPLRSDSVSCLHALEHFGLGRYGDPIRFDGWSVGLRNIVSILEPAGVLYLSVPVGRDQRVEFNAHRVFAVPTIRNEIRKYCSIDSLHVVGDDGNLQRNLNPDSAQANQSFDLNYGCAIFICKKN